MRIGGSEILKPLARGLLLVLVLVLAIFGLSHITGRNGPLPSTSTGDPPIAATTSGSAVVDETSPNTNCDIQTVGFVGPDLGYAAAVGLPVAEFGESPVGVFQVTWRSKEPEGGPVVRDFIEIAVTSASSPDLLAEPRGPWWAPSDFPKEETGDSPVLGEYRLIRLFEDDLEPWMVVEWSTTQAHLRLQWREFA